MALTIAQRGGDVGSTLSEVDLVVAAANEFLFLHRPAEPGDSFKGMVRIMPYNWFRQHYSGKVRDINLLNQMCDRVDPNLTNRAWVRREMNENTEQSEPLRKRYYRTVFVVEVLSQDRAVDHMDLREVMDEAEVGDFSALISDITVSELTAKEAAAELIKQQSDPEFFGLTETGEPAQ